MRAEVQKQLGGSHCINSKVVHALGDSNMLVSSRASFRPGTEVGADVLKIKSYKLELPGPSFSRHV